MQVYAWMGFQLLIFGIWVTQVFHSSPDQVKNSKGREQGNLLRDTPSNKHTHNQTKTPSQHDSLELSNVDCVSSNAMSSQISAMLYIFEYNEAVIKMIMKGRSPTMRHVSRTHRVALDWLFDRINLDQKIEIKYVDTKHQLADILTKGNFTRDEWNNLVHLTSAISDQFAALIISAPPVAVKRWRKGCKKRKEKRKHCGKVKTDVEFGLACCDKFFDSAKSNCIEKSGDTLST